MTTFRMEYGDWQKYRKLQPMMEVSFQRHGEGQRTETYNEAMDGVHVVALRELKKAKRRSLDYVLFMHGESTVGPFRRTAGSVVRKLMRSKEVRPLIIRSKCIQHPAVFLAALRPEPGAVRLVARPKKSENPTWQDVVLEAHCKFPGNDNKAASRAESKLLGLSPLSDSQMQEIIAFTAWSRVGHTELATGFGDCHEWMEFVLAAPEELLSDTEMVSRQAVESILEFGPWPENNMRRLYRNAAHILLAQI